MALGILLPDGRLITDPDWQCVADVMKSAHGQGYKRVIGELVEVS